MLSRTTVDAVRGQTDPFSLEADWERHARASLNRIIDFLLCLATFDVSHPLPMMIFL